MKAFKKAVALMLCFVMTLGVFAVSGITVDDLAGLFTPKAEAYTNTTIGRITQQQVVGTSTSMDGILARDFWYEVYSGDYFNGHSEPTNMVIPGLGDGDDYTPQGMTYWEAKNWVLISAYDASGQKRASCVYAIDVASGKFVALFNLKNADGSNNTSHGGGIAVSEHNFYFADTASKVSYIPLSDLEKVEQESDREIDIKIKGSVDFAGEMNSAKTSYCCYDDGVLWVGNFYLDSEDSYKQPANANHNSMLLGYKLFGNSSEEEWDYLCGKYGNLINVTNAGVSDSNCDFKVADYTTGKGSYSWAAFKNGSSVDITGKISVTPGSITDDVLALVEQFYGVKEAICAELAPNYATANLELGKDYVLSYISTNKQTDMYMFAPGGAHCSVKNAVDIEELDDGRYLYRLEFTAGLKPAGSDSFWPETLSTDQNAYTGTYTIRFDQDMVLSSEGTRHFAITDISLTQANPNLLTLKHTSLDGDLAYDISTNTNGSYTITGSATNSTAAEKEMTSNYATLDLVEGETYTLSFRSNNQLTDAYIFAPAGATIPNNDFGTSVHLRLCPQRGVANGDGTYTYTATFTAGKNTQSSRGWDYVWPVEQSTNGSFTGTYTLRFDQDSIPANSTRNFTISDIKLRKADSNRNIDRIHFAGTAGNPTYIVAFPNNITADIKHHNAEIGATIPFQRIQYAMVDNGRIYVSRSWSRTMTKGDYISEIDIIDIDLNIPGTYSLTVGGKARNDCYLISDSSIKQFHNLSMGEAVCVIDDYLYMFTESAAYNYRAKSSDTRDGNVSTQPVDVVWKIDQYALLGQERKETVGGLNQRSTSGYVDSYERINSLDELSYNDIYMIVYESETKAANGNKILYALDSYGGFKDGLVPKNSNGDQKNTADSIGIVGHPISKYAVDGDILKLNDVVSDDKDSLHWSLVGADTGAFRIQNHDSYYGEFKNLYFGSRLIYMMDSEYTKNSNGTISKQLDHMKIKDNGDGTFSFYYDGDADYYLWCNDGSNQAYMNAYDSLYSNTYAFGGDNPETTEGETETGVKAYAGQKELSGTFHTDAFAKKDINNSGNKTGAAVNEKYTKFAIYRRAKDLSSSGKSGLSTDLSAELQADGTYTLTLESYSTGKTITKKVADGKPIDFVFVLDTSSSMIDKKDVPYWGISDYPEAYRYYLTEDQGGKRHIRYQNDYFGMWPQTERYGLTNYFNSALYTGDDSTKTDYHFALNGELRSNKIDNQETLLKTYGFESKNNDNQNRGHAGSYYWVDRTGDANRFEALKKSTLDFIQQIEDHAKKTGLQHRIAIVQYGSTSSMDTTQYEDQGYKNTGMYTTSNGVNMVNYGTLDDGFWKVLDHTGKTANGNSNNGTSKNGYGYARNNAVYENAFFPANHDNLEQIVNNLSIDGNVDTFVDHGMTMAFNALADQMSYLNTEDGDRVYGTYSNEEVNTRAVVINITDGAPGYSKTDGDAAYQSAKGAIEMANSMKDYGVDIYSVQIGSDTTVDFPNSEYLDALSSNWDNASVTSKYETTKNSLNKGTAKGTGYFIQHNLANKLELDSLFNQISEAGDGSLLEVETVTLDGDSVTHTKLGDTFKLTNDSEATVMIASTYYDSLGRLHEEAPVITKDYEAIPTVSDNTVKLTGFNYSDKYIADGHTGEKLIIQIDGVLLNPDKTLGLNLPISNDAVTAIYADSNAVSNKTPTQLFPQAYFEAPTYSYVYDFGLSMTNSSIYGKPISFDTVPDKQSTYAKSINISGDSAIEYNGSTVTSNIAPTCNGVRESYVLLQKPNGSYYWAKINMIPASNVYYEETFMSAVASSNPDWTATSSSTAGLSQSMSGANDRYGYDAAYETNRQYSNGTAKYVTVDATKNRSDTQKFTFTGTGFDLIGSCGTNTGVQIVTVKDSSNKIKKVVVVDTYYKDTVNNFGTLNQVPIANFNGAYGTYTVEVTAAYLSSANAVKKSAVETYAIDGTEIEATSAVLTNDEMVAEMLAEIGMEELANEEIEIIWMDDNSVFNGGTGAGTVEEGEVSMFATALDNYIDGFRVYNPMQDQSKYIASEQGAQYYNVINNLAKTSGGIFTNIKEDIFAYVEGATFGEANFANYQKTGPQNELYLANGSKGVTFSVNVPSGGKVMLGVRAVTGSPKLNVNGQEQTITSATEMYYDVTKAVSDAGGVVAIKNNGDGLLAVNNIKLVGASVATVDMFSLDDVKMLMAAPAKEVVFNATSDGVVAYPGSEPVREIENPDPDLDPVGEYVITYPDTDGDTDNDGTTDWIEVVIGYIRSFFSDVFGSIKQFFELIISFFTTKEVF